MISLLKYILLQVSDQEILPVTVKKTIVRIYENLLKSKLWGISRCYSQKQYFLFHVECCMICKPVIIVEWFYLYLFILYDPDDWYVNYFNVYQSSPCKSIMVMHFCKINLNKSFWIHRDETLYLKCQGSSLLYKF